MIISNDYFEVALCLVKVVSYFGKLFGKAKAILDWYNEFQLFGKRKEANRIIGEFISNGLCVCVKFHAIKLIL